MSRPSSYHGVSHSDDDFTLPRFAPQQQPYVPPQHIGVTTHNLPPLHPGAPPQRSPGRASRLPPPPAASTTGAGPTSPSSLTAAQQAQQHRHSLSVATHLSPLSLSGGSPYSAQPYPNGAPGTNHATSHGALGVHTNHARAAGLGHSQVAQRQTMHFPYAPSAYEDHNPPSSSSGAGGALSSLARSASLGTGRKKDPFSYPSDDVESGMAAETSWGTGGPSVGGGPAGAPTGNSYASFRAPQVTQQMPQPYVRQHATDTDRDVIMSPGRYPASSTSASATTGSASASAPASAVPSQSGPPQPSAATTSATAPTSATMASSSAAAAGANASAQAGSMAPPPVPHARGLPSPTFGSSQQTPAASQPPSQPPSQPLNPYIPRDAPQQLSDSWLSYRRTSHHSPGSDVVSPPGASPHSPSMTGPYDPSPHLLTPQGSTKNLPSSPNQQHAATMQGDISHTSPRYTPSSYRPSTNHRSHSQSFASSQPVTPSGRHDSGGGSSHAADRGPYVVPGSRQGFRQVRDYSDLKPHVNTQAQGRRADPDVPGGYLSPLKCLTAHLPQTYTLCNPTFKYESSDNPRRVLTKPSKPTYNDGADNEDWDYILYVNDVLGGEHGGDRYLILDVLGQGTFGQVVKCQNMRTHEICAVKVVKNKPAYLNQSKMEVAILELLNREHDPRDEHHILRMHDSFTHKNHLCLVFECLSSNLYELIKQNQFKGLSLQLVKVFTQQLLDCLAVLKNASLIHCDLKPENILLKSLQSPQIKVIDFGSACHERQTVYTYIQSRFYRSPEVLLGLPYRCAIDMWSLGCIVVELFLGLPIFPGTSEYNQVSRIVDMLGLPPQHLLEQGKQTNEFFNFMGVDAHGRKQYKIKPMEQYASEHRTKEQPSKQYFKQTQLPDIIMEYPHAKKNAKPSDLEKETQQRRAFINFVEGLLTLDPLKRWSPQQAAKHPFITGEKYTGPFEPSAPPSRRGTTPAAAVTTQATAATTPVTSKKYGGLVQSPSSQRGQRVYSDAAAYNHQLAQHQYQTAQAQAAQNAARQGPFSPGYDASGQQYGKAARGSTQHPPPPPSWHQPMAPSQQQQPSQQQGYHGRMAGGAAGQVRPNVPIINAPANPPNTYFPGSRNRANTINQMDAIPPALARLTNLGAPDPSGNRSSLTPVLHREDMVEAWERRQAGGHKHSSLHNTTYPQLELLQQQAELANMNQQGYVGYGHPGSHHVPAGPALGHQRASQSFSGTQAYQMQPAMGPHVSHGSHGSVDYRSRGGGAPPIQLQPTNEYDPPGHSTSSRYNLPAFPPPVATTTHGAHGHGSQPSSATFDAFDGRGDSNAALMYTPLQPTQAGAYGPYSPGHASRSSYSGPFNGTQRNNPFAAGQSPSSPRRYGGGGYGQA